MNRLDCIQSRTCNKHDDRHCHVYNKDNIWQTYCIITDLVVKFKLINEFSYEGIIREAIPGLGNR